MLSGDQITSTYNYTKDKIKELNNTQEQQLDLIAAFKEGKIIIRRIESALKEYDKGTEEHDELSQILEKAIHEYNELELAFVNAKRSENKVSSSERKSIMLELSDIINIDEEHKDITDEFRIWDTLGGIGEFFGTGASNKRVNKIVEESKDLRETDIVRQREGQAKELVENANIFFKEAFNKKLDGDPIYQTAFSEELLKQKNEFNQSYHQYLDGDISIEELESQMDDIELLNIDMLTEALLEGASYFIGDLFSDNTSSLPEMKKRLGKMNLIYLASRANNLSGTESFKEERDEVANKIIKLEQGKGIGIGAHETIGAITYNTEEIKANINNGNYKDVDKYQLFFYIQNEHANFSNETITQLLTQYPREFVRYISGQFLNEKGIMSALLGEDNNDFLLHLKDIDKVINLDNIDDLNKATNQLNETEIKDAKKELLSPEARNNLLEKMRNISPEELNDVMKELRLYSIQQTLIENKNKFIIDIENENGREKTDILFKKALELAPALVEKGLYGDELITFLITEIKKDNGVPGLCINNKNTAEILQAFYEADSLSTLTLKEISGDRNFSIPGDSLHLFQETILTQKESSLQGELRIKQLKTLSNEDFNDFTEMIVNGESFDNIDIYFSEINEDYKLLQEKNDEKILDNQAGNNKSNTINESVKIQQIFKEDERIQINNGQPEIITQQGKNAKLSENDLLSIEQNPDNLNNIINCCNIMNDTGFGNLWDGKDYVFKSISNSIGIGFNLDGDYLNINEIRIMFNTILKSLGYSEINGLANEESIRNYVKNINGVQIGGETKDANKAGDSKLEDEFFKKYFPKNSTFGFKSSKFEQAIS